MTVINGVSLRQQLLFLYLGSPNPESGTVAWSLFDGTGREQRSSGDAEDPPYATVVEAMREGWRVIQVASQPPPLPGLEHRTSYLPYEFILERMVEVSHG